MIEKVNHPDHYGGDVKYEAIKLIKDWGLGFSAGNALKYIVRASKKGDLVENLQKAVWYLNDAIDSGETPSEHYGWLWMLLPMVAIAFLNALGIHPPRTTELDPGEAAKFHELPHRLGRALEYLQSGGYRLALVYVSDELTLREGQAAQEVSRAAV